MERLKALYHKYWWMTYFLTVVLFVIFLYGLSFLLPVFIKIDETNDFLIF